ncbi:winged helix DNA-binding protein [uncultured Cytophaga sp.]|uniref:MarR family winged helix-turn-helix transcriptional regulator n=1 Tax=uncultured Cytophaga sp. TaxID=160238 RepID=UPI0026345B38|nr:winged helix DNA-binding protein [uncultured Cytophaga sp.]
MSDKLVELVNLWYSFEKEHPKAEIHDFCKAYLLGNSSNKQVSIKFTKENPRGKVLGRALNRLSKMSIFYSRKNLVDLELKTLDDFVFLQKLTELGTLTKKQLIDLHVTEYTTGIEIIKRLIQLGLVKEKVNIEDKRATSISTTAKGKAFLQRCYPYMEQIGSVIFGPLEEEEASQLAHTLSKLDVIHTNLYHTQRDATLSELQKIIRAIEK